MILAPLPIWWFLDCGPWRPGIPVNRQDGDRILLALNRDPGEYSSCNGTEWYFGERCPMPRRRPQETCADI